MPYLCTYLLKLCICVRMYVCRLCIYVWFSPLLRQWNAVPPSFLSQWAKNGTQEDIYFSLKFVTIKVNHLKALPLLFFVPLEYEKIHGHLKIELLGTFLLWGKLWFYLMTQQFWQRALIPYPSKLLPLKRVMTMKKIGNINFDGIVTPYRKSKLTMLWW